MLPICAIGTNVYVSRRRTKYMNTLLNMLKDKIAKGEDKPCITGNILKDPEAKLDDSKCSQSPRTLLS